MPGKTSRTGGPLRGTARPNQFKLSGTAITVPASETRNRPRRPGRYPAWTHRSRRPRRRNGPGHLLLPHGAIHLESALLRFRLAAKTARPLPCSSSPKATRCAGLALGSQGCHGRLTSLISERQSRPRRPGHYPAWTHHCRRPWRCRACRRLCRRRWR